MCEQERLKTKSDSSIPKDQVKLSKEEDALEQCVPKLNRLADGTADAASESTGIIDESQSALHRWETEPDLSNGHPATDSVKIIDKNQPVDVEMHEEATPRTDSTQTMTLSGNHSESTDSGIQSVDENTQEEEKVVELVCRENSLVHRIFGGKMTTSHKCLCCGTESVHEEFFSDLHLAFPEAMNRKPSADSPTSSKKFSDKSATIVADEAAATWPDHGRVNDGPCATPLMETTGHCCDSKIVCGEPFSGAEKENYGHKSNPQSPKIEPVLGPELQDSAPAFGPQLPETATAFESQLPETAFGPQLPDTVTAFGPQLPETATAFEPQLPETATAFGSQLPETATAFGPQLPNATTSFGPQLPDTKSECGPEVSTSDSSTDTTVLSVQSLLDYNLAAERLEGDNRYRCDRCSDLQDAERTLARTRAPQHLLLTVLRFRYDRLLQRRAKITTRISFSESLDLPVNGRLETYILYAVVIHSGLSMDGGHYYTIARSSHIAPLDPSAKHWLMFNDSVVSFTDLQSLVNLSTKYPMDTPYLLWYRRLSGASSDCVAGELKHAPAHLREVVERDNLRFTQETQGPLAPRNGRSERDDDGGGGGNDPTNAPRFVF